VSDLKRSILRLYGPPWWRPLARRRWRKVVLGSPSFHGYVEQQRLAMLAEVRRRREREDGWLAEEGEG
jgi:hypothetical protein